jgi:flagellar biosynthesis protein FlhA
VRLRDDGARAPDTYAIRVRDRIVGEGALRLEHLLAVGRPAALAQLGGEPVREPVYGLEARAIAPARREEAIRLGILTFDAISILGSHLSEIVRRHASELLGRQEFHTLIEHLRAGVPSLVKDVGGDLVPIAVAHRVFTQLLKERAWPRDPIAVLEAILDAAPVTRDPRELTEAARRAIVPQQFRRDGTRVIRPLVLDPALDAELIETWTAAHGSAPDPLTAQHIRDRVARYLGDRARAPHAIVTGAALRPILAEFLDRSGLTIDVFAFTEIPPDVAVEPAAMIDVPPARALTAS